ncbi:MarR family winged helix-turn-helix transcriptional regulator [Spirillospora sp. CA-294931]|uniref:MarR family winged helix-turn-helix transcriptional regulator n=1 Tax=Spirillospora sp. CA-294931 TaxID=3240042 RepID=UPI003D90B3AC
MTETGPLTPRELRAWQAFLEASHLLEEQIQRQLKSDGDLSHAEFEVLVTLHLAEGHRLRMSDLARGAAVSKSRLTYQVKQLERAGLVRRTACDSDRRAVWAELTDAGAAAVDRVRPGHRRLVRENLINVLSPADLDQLGDILARVAARLRER